MDKIVIPELRLLKRGKSIVGLQIKVIRATSETYLSDKKRNPNDIDVSRNRPPQLSDSAPRKWAVAEEVWEDVPIVEI